MTDQDILDNAPDGATHFIQQTLSVVYFKYNKQIPLHWCNDKKGWRGSLYFEFNNFRLLEDTKRIVELEKLGNEMAIIIADLRAHLKIRGE